MKNKHLQKINFFPRLFIPVILAGIMALSLKGFSQITYENMPTGSFIINMGIVPQTVGNALKPYGMIYDLIKNYGVPIKWIVNKPRVRTGLILLITE